MQRTRLSMLVSQTGQRLSQWVFNPWRRLSLVAISLLFGNFFGSAIAATAGQAAKLDIVIAALLLAMVEVISWLFYRGRLAEPTQQRPIVTDLLHAFKLGMTYSLFVEAFKLGS
ncbi:MAG: DUF565 domain-containing protein [Cyanobacteria bacterium P01_A01_bin.114]